MLSKTAYQSALKVEPFAPASDDERYSLTRIITVAVMTFGCMVPVTMLVPALKELVADRYGASAFWTHAFMSINMIGAVLAGPLIGRLADGRYQRKHVAAAALAADAVLLSMMSFAPTLPVLFGLRFLEGAAHIIALSSLMAVASAWSDPARRGRTMGVVGALMMFGTAFGTRIGGLVSQKMPGWTFHAAGFISAALALLVFAILSEPRAGKRIERTGSGLRRLLVERPALWIAFAFAFIDRFCVGVVITTFGLFLADVHAMQPDVRSSTLLYFLLPFAALVLPAGWLIDRIGRVWPIVLGNMGFGLVFSLYGFVSTAYLNVVMLLSGILSALMFAPNLTLCADLSPPQQRGSAFAGFNIAGSLGFVLGPVCAGAIFTGVSSAGSTLTAYRVTFCISGGMVALIGAAAIPFLLRLRRDGATR